ncbi:solute carrier family 51 subunit alpha [Rhinolophus ferrumequinum]|uniref:Solute carrier family 51 subunit alpha n=1 Tax=Rhinolophus ferrumequinum TaxID=59479 RepID=A0A7J8AGP5_RHIFE|nr:solute carrier family 51 subunit alpha [Rhinolophus ferrumequinum]
MEPDRTQIKLDPRYTADLLEILKNNYSIPSACFSHPPTAAQLLRALGPVEIALTVVMTVLVLGSIAIFLEDAVYLYKNTRCPIKRRTLLWSSSAPTVLRGVLLPADAGHGGRLWWEGGSSEDTEGHADEDPHRPLLLLLPLLPPTHAHQEEAPAADVRSIPVRLLQDSTVSGGPVSRP